MNRLEKYCSLLESIYGERIVKSFTTRNENFLTLTMNDEGNNQKAKKDYDREEGEGCKICKDKFRNERKINFFKRILEFPGWIGELNFAGTTSAKEIMIIGEAPTTLKDQINIAFGLGYYPIDSNGKLNFDQLRKTYSGEEELLNKIIYNQTNKNKLWEYQNSLFSERLNDIKRKIYITDLCKCNDDIKSKIKKEQKNTIIWKICCKNYLIKEIELINPKLIIFQGWSSYIYLKDYLKKEEDIIVPMNAISDSDNIKKYYPKYKDYSKTSLCYNPFYGKFPFHGNQIHFFVIFHQTNFIGRNKNICKRTDYIDRHKEFVKKEILKEVLKINQKKN